MNIRITDTFREDKYEQYEIWMRSVRSDLRTTKLSYSVKNGSEIQNLDGLILTGGGDIDPCYYEKHDEVHKVKGVDTKRDAFEFGLIDQALEMDIPILGVCRGMQTMNVYLGGSLVMDLVTSRFENHAGTDEKKCKHSISIIPSTLMHAIINTEEIEINSYHHQAIDRLGRGLMMSATSYDGVTEAAEWIVKDGMPFLMLVQWHPERLYESVLSQKIALMFLREVYQYHRRS